MSPPTRANLKGYVLELGHEDERLSAFISACRRRHRADALHELTRWEPLGYGWSEGSRDLTIWVRDECRLHVEAERFEYALVLVERYRRQPFTTMRQTPLEKLMQEQAAQ